MWRIEELEAKAHKDETGKGVKQDSEEYQHFVMTFVIRNPL